MSSSICHPSLKSYHPSEFPDAALKAKTRLVNENDKGEHVKIEVIGSRWGLEAKTAIEGLQLIQENPLNKTQDVNKLVHDNYYYVIDNFLLVKYELTRSVQDGLEFFIDVLHWVEISPQDTVKLVDSDGKALDLSQENVTQEQQSLKIAASAGQKAIDIAITNSFTSNYIWIGR